MPNRPISLDSKAHILVIDDEPLLCELYHDILSEEGYRLFICTAGFTGLLHIMNQEETIDVIILDLHLPDISGHQLINDIMTFRPFAKILLCSGDVTHNFSILEQGKSNILFMQKPFQIATLLKNIETLLAA